MPLLAILVGLQIESKNCQKRGVFVSFVVPNKRRESFDTEYDRAKVPQYSGKDPCLPLVI